LSGGEMNKLAGARCCITGGAGFVGSAIADQLVSAGAAEVRIIDNFVRGSWSNLAWAMEQPGVSVLEGDIRDRDLVEQLIEGTDYVFHQAALRITRCAEAPREAVEVLIDGTMNVLETSLKYGVKKVVAASSASVYGEPWYLPIDENHPFNNRTMYGAGKIAMEHMLRALYTTSGLNYVALRYFNIYGPRMDVTGVYTEVLVRWLDAIDAGTAPLIFGDGKQSMDFVYVDDVARANLLAAQSDVTDEVFNVGTGIQTSLSELCQLLLHLTGSDLSPEYRDARAVAHVQVRRAAVEKGAQQLGFKSTVKIAEGLQELVRWRQALRTNTLAVAQ
jgi:UDP-glucose 4-epimerase